MSTPRMFWFFLWRMTLWGLGLGSGLGTTYGLLVGGLTFPHEIGLMLVGPLFGAVGRLVLGLLEGVVLGAVTVLWHRGGAAGDPFAVPAGGGAGLRRSMYRGVGTVFRTHGSHERNVFRSRTSVRQRGCGVRVDRCGGPLVSCYWSLVVGGQEGGWTVHERVWRTGK
jgi:hypothetical protein